MIPISKVKLGKAEERLVKKVLRSGMLAQGRMVSELETDFAKSLKVKHAIAVNNGTTALVAALSVFDLKPGDEVITTPFTFVATLNAILSTGATARFADINESDFNINPKSVEKLINERTKVVLPVHLYGQMSDMGEISRIAREHGLSILEDSAQSQGATFDGKYAGTYDIGTFSLYATKNMTTGEGGIITTNSDEVADRIRIYRNQGMRSKYEYEMVGSNFRMTDLQAAVGIPQLKKYGKNVKVRNENANYLLSQLDNYPGLILPTTNPNRSHVWHQFTLRIPSNAQVTREEFINNMNKLGVGTGIYYPRAVYKYPPFENNSQVIQDSCPVADQISSEVVSIPIHPHLSRQDLKTIASSVKKSLSKSF